MAIATFTRAGAAGVALAPRQRRFVHLYLLILLLAFSPLKAVALVLPLLFIAGLLFYVGTRARHNLRNLSLVAIFYVLLGALQLLAAPQFSPLTYALFAVTASSFLVFFMDLRPFADAHTIRSLRQVTLVVLTVEALFGLLQGAVSAARHGTFDGGVGDAVAGTIHLGFEGTSTLNNAMFAILVSGLLLFLLATSTKRFSRGEMRVYALVLSAWLLASVMHTIIYVFLAGLMAAFLIWIVRAVAASLSSSIPIMSWRVKRSTLSIGAIIVAFLILIPLLLPGNTSNLLTSYAPTVLTGGINPTTPNLKARLLYIIHSQLPAESPLQPLIGLGAGQFNSRASLIATGEYLQGAEVPFSYMSELTGKYFWPLLALPNFGGSTFSPFSSWLVSYAEFGLLGLLVMAGGFGLLLWRFISVRLSQWPRLRLCASTLTLYLFLLGYHENYWEVPQAILPLCIGLTLLRAHIAFMARAHAPVLALPPNRDMNPAQQVG